MGVLGLSLPKADGRVRLEDAVGLARGGSANHSGVAIPGTAARHCASTTRLIVEAGQPVPLLMKYYEEERG